MRDARQPLAARVWGPLYRTWFPPDVPRQRRRAKRRSARRERQRADNAFHDLVALTEELGLYNDCRHGCNGSPCGSEQCTFICHPRD